MPCSQAVVIEQEDGTVEEGRGMKGLWLCLGGHIKQQIDSPSTQAAVSRERILSRIEG